MGMILRGEGEYLRDKFVSTGKEER